MPPSEVELAARVAQAEKLAVAIALNSVEDRRPASLPAIEGLLRALAATRSDDYGHRVGLTGPPGVGKSTLTAALARNQRERGRSVGVLAVDPSSTRSGGALLGDRARMAFDPDDAGLFVRSLATAGDLGGLAYAANAAVQVLAAAFDRVLVETTGVGQTETDVEQVVDTVCLVIQPGSGDVLQFIKAGIMEIPDVIVVNKADHGRLAQRAAADIAGALDRLRTAGMGDEARSWKLPVLVTSARDRVGISELIDAFEAHRATFTAAGLAEKRRSGGANWAASLFVRMHGEHGQRFFGDRAQLVAQMRQRLEQSEQPVGAALALSEVYLRSLRGMR
ncbi:MAG TPA: methylmalonyl Co-A mutase-associated GTPase MeaB [Polyangiales bacterium]|nr:methylmalonyl Co-A mutase-associated GTPase MeaB [Polyangiales bacterium]